MADRTPGVIYRNVESVGLARPKLDPATAVQAIVGAAGALERALATTTAPDVAALAAGATTAVAMPAASWPTVDALTTQTLAGGSTRLPVPQPVPAATEQAAEKDPLPGHKFTLALDTFTPRTFAQATNLSGPADPARAWVEASLSASVAAQVDRAVLAELDTAAGAGVADVGAGVAAVVAAGWSDVVLVVPLAVAVMDAANYAALGQLGSAVVVDPHAAGVLVVARDGVALAVAGPEVLRGQPEPALVGSEVGAWASYQLSLGTGAVAIVTAP